MTGPSAAFSDAERDQLERVLSILRQRDWRAESWSSLVEEWRSFVRDVGNGYDLTIYDFTNDLSVRDIIEAVLEQLPTSLSAALAEQVDAVDAGFKAVTRSVPRPLLPGADKGAWWWSRVPLHPAGELLDDLKQEGLASG